MQAMVTTTILHPAPDQAVTRGPADHAPRLADAGHATGTAAVNRFVIWEFCLVELSGLEPLTPCLQTRQSVVADQREW
jgi:hypothetical protein